MARAARGGAKAAAGSPAKRAASSSVKRGRADANQSVIDDAAADAAVAAADAAAEAATLHGDSEGEEDNGAGGAKKQKLPHGLLERRLDKANADKNEMANKIAELEKRLAEKGELPVAVSPRHETGSNAGLKVAL